MGAFAFDMEPKELNLNRDFETGSSGGGGGGCGGGGGGADGFIDRSRVRILLCDNNESSSEEVFTLLVKCSYQGMNIFYLFYYFCKSSLL